MRLCRLPIVLVAAATLTACAQQPRPGYYAASPYAQPRYASQQYPQQARSAQPSSRSDLDMMMYGAPAPYRVAVPSGYRPAHQAYAASPPGYAPPPAYRPAPVYRPPPPVYSPPVYRPPAVSYQQPRPVRAMPIDDGPYTLDTGDRLRIVVYGQDTLSNSYTVDAAGQVTMPLIGAVLARDLTPAALSAAIRSRLASGFIREPSVAVEVETYRPFFVLGEVTYPGQYPYVPRMTVENAVAIAGGFTPRAGKDKVTVTRKVQGVPSRFTLPLQYPLRPGDIVTVAERWF